ncbi:MAG: uroporphyrinogen-III synthase [Planctomycetota bacterium]|jgi:uroporphyrinogen-III synthase
MKILDGKRIALTRSPEGNREWTRAIEEVGATVLDWPCIETHLLDESRASFVQGYANCHWIAFTSARAVFGAIELAPELNLSAKRLACVGKQTAMALGAAGISVELIASEATAESLGRELIAKTSCEERILILSARDGRQELPRLLQEYGHTYDEVALYKTTARASYAGSPLPSIDAVFFASPSAVRGFAENWSVPTRSRSISIGPTTTEELRATGIPVDAEAQDRDLQGMLNALASALQ